MNNAHRKTLAAIFSNPVPKGLEKMAARVEVLLVACGCGLYEGSGSRVSFSKGDAVLETNRPHPRKEAKPYQVRDVRAFLIHIGVTPQEDGI